MNRKNNKSQKSQNQELNTHYTICSKLFHSPGRDLKSQSKINSQNKIKSLLEKSNLSKDQMLKIVRDVLVENHHYYVNHPLYPMPKPCMWPDEVLAEITAKLNHPNIKKGAL